MDNCFVRGTTEAYIVELDGITEFTAGDIIDVSLFMTHKGVKTDISERCEVDTVNDWIKTAFTQEDTFAMQAGCSVRFQMDVKYGLAGGGFQVSRLAEDVYEVKDSDRTEVM